MLAGTDRGTECGPSFITDDAQELDFGGAVTLFGFADLNSSQIKKEIKTNP